MIYSQIAESKKTPASIPISISWIEYIDELPNIYALNTADFHREYWNNQ